jgi:hypothetical protein
MTEEWTAPPVERSEPGRILAERHALEAWLDFHRDTPLLKCAGLTADQLKEPAVPPSRHSLLGLVRHMTEVERWWFRMHAANTDLPFPYDPDATGQDFEALDDADAAANIGHSKKKQSTQALPWQGSISMTSCPATVTTRSAPRTFAGSTCT